MKFDALYKACENADYLVIENLLEKGEDPDSKDHPEKPLIFACYNKDYDMVRLLLKFNASPNIRDNEGLYPLLVSFLEDDCESARLLLRAGAKQPSFLLRECIYYCRWDFAKLLLRYGADPNDYFVLMLTCSKNNQYMVEYLIRRGCHKNLNEALVIAIENDNYQITKTLLNHGATLEKRQLKRRLSEEAEQVQKLLLQYDCC